MQVHYDEGLAIHIGPEPCVGVRKDDSEASRARGETARDTSEGMSFAASARVALFRDFPSGFSAWCSSSRRRSGPFGHSGEPQSL